MKPVLSILMPTYNHEKFISQAINSVLEQKTSYSFELLINDDCSTDNTSKIACSYAERHPEIIKFSQSQHNLGLMKNYKYLLERAQGTYIAILESDDIWCDCEKIQKQIDFLEHNQNYGICVSDYRTIDSDNTIIREYHKTDDNGLNDNWYGNLLYTNFICAATICFSKKYYDMYCDIDAYIAKNFLTFDLPLLLDISANTKCHYIHEITSSYRVLSTSISNTTNYKKNMNFENSVFQIQLYSIERWGTGNFSKDVIVEKRISECLDKALSNHCFKDYLYFARNLHSKNIKRKLIHIFPSIFYIQHILRGF